MSERILVHHGSKQWVKIKFITDWFWNTPRAWLLLGKGEKVPKGYTKVSDKERKRLVNEIIEDNPAAS